MIEAWNLICLILGWILILIGGGFIFTGALGVLRMPDVFTRQHAAGLTDTLGSGFMLGGFIVQSGFSQTSLKLGLIFLFIYFTSPVAAHALAYAAYSRGQGTPPEEDRLKAEEKTASNTP